MTRKRIGIHLAVFGGVSIVILLSFGGTITPHIYGATIAVVGIHLAVLVGMALLIMKRRSKHNG